jgi:hypothetical protein
MVEKALGAVGKARYSSAMLRWLLTICILSGGLTACELDYEEETHLFERAEEHFRAGDYEGARELYARFLELHRRSPLRPIAEQRNRLIDRELDAVTGRRGAPAPVRVNPLGAQGGQEAVTPVPQFESPRLRSLGE